jgi:hypothetical protein
MARKQRDPIPAEFHAVAEAAEFWDTHDLGDYQDQLTTVSVEVDLQRRTFLAALEPELAKKVSDYAATQGVASETLNRVLFSDGVRVARGAGLRRDLDVMHLARRSGDRESASPLPPRLRSRP